MLNRRLEEKKNSNVVMKRQHKELNALEEDRRRVNQANNNNLVQLVIPTESRMGTYTKRENSIVKKQSNLQNASSFKMHKGQGLPIKDVAIVGGSASIKQITPYHHSHSAMI